MNEVNELVGLSRRRHRSSRRGSDDSDYVPGTQEEAALRTHRRDPAGMEFVSPAFIRNVAAHQGAGSLQGHLRGTDLYLSTSPGLQRSRRELLTLTVALDVLMRGSIIDAVEVMVRRINCLTHHGETVMKNNGKTSASDWAEAIELESQLSGHDTSTVLRSEKRLARKAARE
jgi:hypothetical protein